MKSYHEAFLKLIEENKNTIAKKLEKDPDFIQSIMNFAIKNSSKILFRDLDKDKKNMLDENRKISLEYNKRLYRQWKKPIDNLETIIEMSHECAEMYCESFIEEAEKEENILFHSLRTIHSRALLTSRECLVLLKNGYADGAFSRWRTLYELSVIGALLFEKKDNDLCERYLNYFHIQAYKEEQLNREKGHPSHTDDSFANLKDNYDYVIEKHDKDYAKGEYGWANKLLNRRANFRDIEDAADMGNLRGYYKSSSMFVHGNYKASQESLGLIPNIDRMLLVGPSNYGLSIPMQNVAISLVSITSCFLLVYPTFDTMSACSILQKFMEKILIEADKIQTKIENNEMKFRGEHSNILITSFKGKNNSSKLLLDKIKTYKSVDKLELTNSFKTSEKELTKKLKNNYKYVISLGQKPLVNKVYIERKAKKDNIVLDTNFSIKEMEKLFKENNINFLVSKNAGNYLCNNIYYEGLKYIKENDLKTKMIFIHVPSANQNYDLDKLAQVISRFLDLLCEEKWK